MHVHTAGRRQALHRAGDGVGAAPGVQRHAHGEVVQHGQDDRLGEGAAGAAAALLSEDGIVCCTHGDVVEALVGRGLKKGAAVVLRDGAVVQEIPAP